LAGCVDRRIDQESLAVFGNDIAVWRVESYYLSLKEDFWTTRLQRFADKICLG